MSAIREEGADAEPIRVLFTLHHNMNALDFIGPLEVLATALNDTKDEGGRIACADDHPLVSAIGILPLFET